MAGCATAASPAAQVRGWMLPITALVAVLGMLWQGSPWPSPAKANRCCTPYADWARVALWGAVGIAGTQLALRAGDAYAYWILQQAIFGDSANPTETLGTAIAPMSRRRVLHR